MRFPVSRATAAGGCTALHCSVPWGAALLHGGGGGDGQGGYFRRKRTRTTGRAPPGPCKRKRKKKTESSSTAERKSGGRTRDATAALRPCCPILFTHGVALDYGTVPPGAVPLLPTAQYCTVLRCRGSKGVLSHHWYSTVVLYHRDRRVAMLQSTVALLLYIALRWTVRYGTGPA